MPVLEHITDRPARVDAQRVGCSGVTRVRMTSRAGAATARGRSPERSSQRRVMGARCSDGSADIRKSVHNSPANATAMLQAGPRRDAAFCAGRGCGQAIRETLRRGCGALAPGFPRFVACVLRVLGPPAVGCSSLEQGTQGLENQKPDESEPPLPPHPTTKQSETVEEQRHEPLRDHSAENDLHRRSARPYGADAWRGDCAGPGGLFCARDRNSGVWTRPGGSRDRGRNRPGAHRSRRCT